MNQFGVGASGKKVYINNLSPQPRLSAREALNLAAWLAATALPLMPGDAAAELGKFVKLLGDTARENDSEDLAEAVDAELEA